uniref:KOW domain-containing protein n=1 Tax=Corethron hystrix TaxID=216773 RepID=A0A7S1BFK0_9STRA|mmetsp:Transcript_25925/g.59688  ORF Transcript_25925/g.59688 Transcript_25925/m.59688 type:complete len:611 (+) Transcript_25925:139-1971(+)
MPLRNFHGRSSFYSDNTSDTPSSSASPAIVPGLGDSRSNDGLASVRSSAPLRHPSSSARSSLRQTERGCPTSNDGTELRSSAEEEKHALTAKVSLNPFEDEERRYRNGEPLPVSETSSSAAGDGGVNTIITSHNNTCGVRKGKGWRRGIKLVNGSWVPCNKDINGGGRSAIPLKGKKSTAAMSSSSSSSSSSVPAKNSSVEQTLLSSSTISDHLHSQLGWIAIDFPSSSNRSVKKEKKQQQPQQQQKQSQQTQQHCEKKHMISAKNPVLVNSAEDTSKSKRRKLETVVVPEVANDISMPGEENHQKAQGVMASSNTPSASLSSIGTMGTDTITTSATPSSSISNTISVHNTTPVSMLPISNVRTSAYRGRGVLIKDGRFRGCVGTVESTVEGRWVLVSGLLSDNGETEVLLPSGALELLPAFVVPQATAVSSSMVVSSPNEDSAINTTKKTMTGRTSKQTDTAIYNQVVHQDMEENTNTMDLEGFVMQSVCLPIVMLHLRRQSLISLRSQLLDRSQILLPRHHNIHIERSLFQRTKKISESLKELDKEFGKRVNVASILRMKMLGKMKKAAEALQEASSVVFGQEEEEGNEVEEEEEKGMGADKSVIAED